MPLTSDDPLRDLPGLFRPHRLREADDALLRAAALAPSRGAGTLCWLGTPSRFEAAAVLEPDLPLAPARVALWAAAQALAVVLAGFGPGEIPVRLRRHGDGTVLLLVNGAVAGRARLAEPPGAALDAVPDWLAVSAEARLEWPPGREPGLDPGATALREEGFGDVTAAELAAAWARHLMAELYDWREDGFAAFAERVLARLEREPAMGEGRRGLDPNTGDLLLEGRRWPLMGAAPEEAREVAPEGAA